MPDIYVNTDNSNAANKVFDAGKLGTAAAAAEKKMKETVVDALSKAPDFNTNKPGKGYTLKMKVQAASVGRATQYTVTIEIIRYPLSPSMKGKGEEFVGITPRPGTATVEGASESTIVDAIADLTRSNVKASLGPMRVDMARR